MRRARGSPAHDNAGIGIDHKGNVDKAGPGRDIGEVENVRPGRLELAVDVIQRAWRGLVADRGLDGFAADDPLQTHVSISRATVQRATLAFSLELPPDLAHAIDPDVLVEHAPNLDLQRGSPHRWHRTLRITLVFAVRLCEQVFLLQPQHPPSDTPAISVRLAEPPSVAGTGSGQAGEGELGAVAVVLADCVDVSGISPGNNRGD
jgi:hypothetical protein